jgi:hypothetical protein
MTPRSAAPPFSVAVYNDDTLVSRTAFESHDEACAFAVEAFRVASQGNV